MSPRNVPVMAGAELDGARPDFEDVDVAALLPMVRRIIFSRVPNEAAAEDLVQETIVKVLAAANRVEPGMIEPYAIATARNLVTSMWRMRDTQRRNQHRIIDMAHPDAPDERMLKDEERAAVAAALQHLTDREQQTLLAHEISGRDTKSLATELNSSAGAVAAQLSRTRARLRVEYLLARHGAEPPTDRCRAVLYALSSADRRRQREVDAARHLLECDVCSELSEPLLQRAPQHENEVLIRIERDADVVEARKKARELAMRLDFSRTDLTLIATAVSEIARNIVRFAGKGQVFVELLTEPRPGIRIVARDTGPGISDVDRALTDGYSTYSGLGLGLPGARRLMDEFTISSKVDVGTTVTMTKWRTEG
jgi:RNA polymerase sigma factor (sigma-70 family)